MLVLSDEPKALVLTCQKMLSLCENLRTLHTVDTLAMDINMYIRQMRSSGRDFNFIGTAGYYLFMWTEDGVEEIKVMLDIADFYRYADDTDTQQFVKQPGPMQYDISCPTEWREQDEN